MIIALAIPDEVLTERMRGRWIHKASGRSYHVKSARPKSLKEGEDPTAENMLDDLSGEPLIQRADDTEEAFQKRLQAYHSDTAPVLVHYSAIVKKVEGDLGPVETWAAIESMFPQESAKATQKFKNIKNALVNKTAINHS